MLESDEADEGQWLAALVQLPLRIIAAYTSGGRSVHALVRLDASGKAAWDAMRNQLLPVLTPLGADPGALTAVRLTRLPGVLRHGTIDKAGKFAAYAVPRLQKLIWLHPHADHQPILETV